MPCWLDRSFPISFVFARVPLVALGASRGAASWRGWFDLAVGRDFGWQVLVESVFLLLSMPIVRFVALLVDCSIFSLNGMEHAGLY